MTNSIGLSLVLIPAGSFTMGSDHGNFDEKPVHHVTITKPFWASATHVTNAQYEQFDPDHKARRGVVSADDEPAVYVSHDDAVAFCDWLTKHEHRPYRLPTEAEWEYACRAGTTTAFNTGEKLPAEYQHNQKADWAPKPRPLHVGKNPPNAFGLFDMHGLAEQWCADWYGPYAPTDTIDPLGYSTGDFRVSRGGSANTAVRYLRSAARAGSVPSDRSPLIGFRVVRADPLLKPATFRPATRPVPQSPYGWPVEHDPAVPYFAPPISFVNIPPGSNGPLYSKHNHCPSLAACPNGDLLVTFYTCNEEYDREMAVVSTRLRRGSDHFDPDQIFYKAPGRNMHATALWCDGKTLYHFQGLSIGDGWESLALLFRTSADNGQSWSAPRWIDPNHRLRNMPIAGVIGTHDGKIVLPCDAVTGAEGGTAVHVSSDAGNTWSDPGRDTLPLIPDYTKPAATGGTIAGIHAKIVELSDGSWLAFGRGNSIDGRMPQSSSVDFGRTWSYAPTPFPPITGGQRLVLLKLHEGPLLLISFANDPGMTFTDPAGHAFTGHGLFAALSPDDGKTWPTRKLLAPRPGSFNGQGWTGIFTTDATHAEPKGYLAAIQTPDDMIHLLSSGLYYHFNLALLHGDAFEPARK